MLSQNSVLQSLNYLLLSCISLSISFCTCASPSMANERPNIIFILADDLGWGDVSLRGSSQVKTPNIDLLATNGILLNNYYVSPLCTPSRGALLSGLHPIHLGLQHNVLYNRQPWGLPTNIKILPQYLKNLGYETHIVGKWHLGFFQREYLPTNRGFDSHFGYWTGHLDYYRKTSGENPTGFDLRLNERAVNLSHYEDRYMTDIITEKSIDIIKNITKRSKPLFLYIAHSAVHSGLKRDPIQAPQEYIDHFKHIANKKRRKFCAMVSTLDDSVAQVVSALQMTGILNNTIIIFSTDNGGATRGSGHWSIDNSIGSNYPLRGAKYTLFEGGIRAFGFIWSPILRQNYVSHHLMHIHDWLPTIYKAVGGRVEDLGAIDGIDMWTKLIKNSEDGPQSPDSEDSQDRSILHNIDDIWKVWALRDGDYKLISGSTYRGQFDGWNWIIEKDNQSENIIDYKNSLVYKVLKEFNYTIKEVKPIIIECQEKSVKHCVPTDKPCLFDIRSDPCERNNIYDMRPEIVDSMIKLLAKYNSTAVKPVNRPSDEKANPKYHHNFWSVWHSSQTDPDINSLNSSYNFYSDVIKNFIDQ